MALLFSEVDDEILLEEVANYPSLWQMSHVSFKDHRVKSEIWAQIANKVGKPTDQCKKRWRNIKDTYSRKKNRNVVSEDTPTKKGKKWALEGKLSFLRNAEEHRRSFYNLNPSHEDEVDLSSAGDDRISLMQTSTPTETSPPCNTLSQYPATTRRGKRPGNRGKIADILVKRKADRNEIMRTLLTEETDDDDVDLFFKSLAKSVKKLTPALQQQAKVETLNVITKLEAKMWEPVQYGSFKPTNASFKDTSVSASPESLSSYSDADSSPQSLTLT